MARNRPVFAVGLLLFLAGCTQPTDDVGAESSDPPVRTRGPDENVTFEPPQPRTFSLYLTPSRTLSTEKPAAGTYAESESFLDPGFTTGSKEFQPWKAAAPFTEGWRITAATAHVYFSSDTPQTSSKPAIGIGPTALFYGEEDRWGPLVQVDTPQNLDAGVVYHAQAPLPVPAGGFMHLPEATPWLLLGFFYSQTTTHPLKIHVGGEKASEINITAVPYALLPSAGPQSKDHPFSMPNGNEAPTFDVQVNATTARIEVDLSGRTTTVGRFDIDVELLGPGGQRVWASFSPNAREKVRLYAENVKEAGAGVWKVKVTNSSGNAGEGTVTVRIADAGSGY